VQPYWGDVQPYWGFFAALVFLPPRFDLLERLEKLNQDGPLVRGHLRQQADDFEKRPSWTRSAAAGSALLALATVVLRDQLLQCRSHIREGVGGGFVSDCQHAAAFGANPGAN